MDEVTTSLVGSEFLDSVDDRGGSAGVCRVAHPGELDVRARGECVSVCWVSELEGEASQFASIVVVLARDDLSDAVVARDIGRREVSAIVEVVVGWLSAS